MLGNTQLGLLSSAVGVQRAVTYSSLIGVGGVLACARLLPGFRNYLAPVTTPEHESAQPQSA